jgi:hypothetical protein
MSFSSNLEATLSFIEGARAEAIKRRAEFNNINTYCMFIGYPRSGHSLIGSLLDAHPNMVIAHEVDALRCLSAGFGRGVIYNLLLQNSREFTEEGRQWNGYSYNVPNQWHGRYQTLQVIGDKKGGRSSLQLLHHPDLLELIQKTVNVPMRFVHVIRNPYDNITTFSKKHNLGMKEAVDSYFGMVQSVLNIKQKVGDVVFDVRQESFIDNPQTVLKQLCEFLGQETTQAYLDDCASIVFKQPNKSRKDGEWTPELIEVVQANINKVPFLAGYTFES